MVIVMVIAMHRMGCVAVNAVNVAAIVSAARIGSNSLLQTAAAAPTFRP